MSAEPGPYRKLFTIEQANAALPLVRVIVRDLAALSRDVMERRERVAVLLSGREMHAGDPYQDELAHVEQELERDRTRLQEYVEELLALGVEPKNGPDGIVDFPARMDDRIVYLCWRLGEPEVLHWHEIDGGFAGRHPLTADSAAGRADGDDRDEA